MKSILLLSLIALSCALTELEYQSAFTFWMQQYQKSYHHEEFLQRYRIFKSNLDFINKHNAKNLSYVVAMNQFGDLTLEEFSKYYLGTKVTYTGRMHHSSPDPKLPSSLDWVSKGAVTHVKNQGQCGSCWSFSTTGSTEGCHFIKTGTLNSLSEQNLMDCSTSYGNNGCDGGLMTQAMQYIINNKGIDTETSYPYTAEDGTTCNYNSANSGATLSSFVNVQTGNENDLQSKVALGPTSVAIDASQSSFQFYSSGVYSDPDCSTTSLDHGVLAVGWGVDPTGGAYWKVKNSWGASWGLSGYIWMARNDGNMCGIATMATLPQC